MNAQRINTNSNGIICSQVEHKWQGGGRAKSGRGKSVREVGGSKLYKSCCLEVQSILTLFSLLPQQFPPPSCCCCCTVYLRATSAAASSSSSSIFCIFRLE